MNSNHVIIMLLASTLFVLVNGKEEFVKDVEILSWIVYAILVIKIVWVVIKYIKIILVVIKDKLKGVVDNLRTEISAIINQESISFSIAYISMIVFFVVLAVGCLIYFVSGATNLIDAIKEIPFWWAPLALMLFSYVVLMPIENLILTWRGRDVSDAVQSEPEEDC